MDKLCFTLATSTARFARVRSSNFKKVAVPCIERGDDDETVLLFSRP